jgi:cardiolipin synthase
MPEMTFDTRGHSSRILTVPNVLSLFRLGCLPLILLFLYQHDLRWALILFVVAGVTDFLDGLLARLLHQRTLFGMYLDPIADKLLLTSCFLVLAITGEMPWVVTGLVLARDLVIVTTVGVLIFATDIRRFRPTRLGKANTAVQVAAIFAVLLDPVYAWRWVHYARQALVVLTTVLVLASGIHYAYVTLRKVRRRRRAAAQDSC